MELEQAAKIYLSGKSVPVIEKEYGVNRDKLYKFLKNNKMTRSHREKSLKYYCNENFFDDINNEIKAYWLGYICADGYIYKTKYGHAISISSKDVDHLKLFTKDIESNYEVKEYDAKTTYGQTHYGKITITSTKLFNSLNRKGCVERKTKVLLPPKIDKNLERHWIRGYYDGDGSIRISKNSKSGFGLSVLGTQFVIEWIKDRVGGSLWHDSIKDIWYLDTTITLEVLDFLYDNSNRYLQRKFDRAVLARQELYKTSG